MSLCCNAHIGTKPPLPSHPSLHSQGTSGNTTPRDAAEDAGQVCGPVWATFTRHLAPTSGLPLRPGGGPPPPPPPARRRHRRHPPTDSL